MLWRGSPVLKEKPGLSERILTEGLYPVKQLSYAVNQLFHLGGGVNRPFKQIFKWSIQSRRDIEQQVDRNSTFAKFDFAQVVGADM